MQSSLLHLALETDRSDQTPFSFSFCVRKVCRVYPNYVVTVPAFKKVLREGKSPLRLKEFCVRKVVQFPNLLMYFTVKKTRNFQLSFPKPRG